MNFLLWCFYGQQPFHYADHCKPWFSMNHLVIKKYVLRKLNPLPRDMNSFNINYPLQVYLSWTTAKIPWWLSYLLHLKLPHQKKIFFMVFELKLCLQQLFFSSISYESYRNWIVKSGWAMPSFTVLAGVAACKHTQRKYEAKMNI